MQYKDIPERRISSRLHETLQYLETNIRNTRTYFICSKKKLGTN